MAERTVAAGPQRPADHSPFRAPGSVRRTTTVDACWPGGPDGPLVLVGRGRDLRTPANGGPPVVLADETITAEVDGDRTTVRAITADVPAGAIRALAGLPLTGGFRRVLAGLDLGGDTTLIYALLDELPAVALVAGYRLLRLSHPDGPTPHVSVARMLGVCAGWAPEASMARFAQASGRSPTIFGPVAPELADAEDQWSWHDRPPRSPGTVRRSRRTDVGPVAPGGPVELFEPVEPGRQAVDAMFRDAYTEDDGHQTVIHEYAVAAAVEGGRLVSVTADPRVLPAAECPSAAASAGQMEGMPLDDLRIRVRRELRGTRTCTHLNDLLRTFADLPSLMAELR